MLTTQDIVDSYHLGLDAGATHMLIVWDTYDYEDSYDFVVYSYPGKDVNALVKYYTAPGFYHVFAVYAMHLDIAEQLKERSPWHIEYSETL